MVKQIRECKLVGDIIDRGDSYFHWLQKKSGISGPLSSMLADTEFVSLDGLDDVLKKKAKEETRRAYVEDICNETDKDAEILYKSIRGNTCLFEVIFCLANSLNDMFEGSDAFDGPSHFFGKLMANAGFDLYDDEDLDTIGDQVKEYWQKCINRVLNRTYDEHCTLGLFPMKHASGETYSDRRWVSLWQQLNDYVDQHTNEDGEWVD